MTKADIHAFGIEIVYKQLEKDGWMLDSADVEEVEVQFLYRQGETFVFMNNKTGAYNCTVRTT